MITSKAKAAASRPHSKTLREPSALLVRLESTSIEQEGYGYEPKTLYGNDCVRKQLCCAGGMEPSLKPSRVW